MAGLGTLDRRVLETVILPALASAEEVRRVLFVGCADYTSEYEGYFPKQAYYTIDRDPSHAAYGAARPGHHFVDSVEHIDRYLQPDSLDAALINGVFGYGLDEADDAEVTLGKCFDLLRDGGVLMIGWNDLPQCTPFVPTELATLERFQRIEFEELRRVQAVRRLPSGDYLVDDDYRHIFSFYRKVDPAPGQPGR